MLIGRLISHKLIEKKIVPRALQVSISKLNGPMAPLIMLRILDQSLGFVDKYKWGEDIHRKKYIEREYIWKKYIYKKKTINIKKVYI